MSGIRREELRGLFVLGLLAILWQSQGIFEEIGKLENIFCKVVPTLNYLLAIFWGGYAIFIILGWSDDILPTWACNELKSLAIAFLKTSFVMSILVSAISLVAQYGLPMVVAMVSSVVSLLVLIAPMRKPTLPKRVSPMKIAKKAKSWLDVNYVPISVFMLWGLAIVGVEKTPLYTQVFFYIGAVITPLIAWMIRIEKRKTKNVSHKQHTNQST